MEGLRIGIVEDEVLTTESISIHLERMGHSVVETHMRFNEAFEGLAGQKPDLFLVDIRLKGKKSGLDVAQKLNSQHGIPFIFLTSHTDSPTVAKAMATKPAGYITKPVSYEDLYIGIELVKAKLSLGKVESRYVELKNGYERERVSVENILYLEAGRSYVTIHMVGENKVLRQPLGGFMQVFQPEEMIRIHRSFAVNPRLVESVTANKVFVAGQKLPLGKGYRKDFEEALRRIQG